MSGLSLKLVARNSFINLAFQVVPVIVALLFLPYAIKGLGTELFGIYTIAITIIFLFNNFNFGIGYAACKMVSESLATGDRKRTEELIWSSFNLNLVLGLLWFCVLFMGARPLVYEILNISPAYRQEAVQIIRYVAYLSPVVLEIILLRALMEAKQKYFYVSAMRAILSSSIIISAALTYFTSLTVVDSIRIVFYTYVAFFCIYLVLVLKEYGLHIRGFKLRFSQHAGELVRFGSWITVTLLIMSVLYYLDRFLIGAYRNMVEVTYYTIPFDFISRVALVSSSLTATLFPAISNWSASRNYDRINYSFGFSLKMLSSLLAVIVLIVIIFCGDFLLFWLGEDFRERSTLVMQVLSVGVLFNSLALVPFRLIIGTGRPDVPAKIIIIQLPLYLLAAFYFIPRYGITAAAIIYSARALTDFLMLSGFLYYSRSYGYLSFNLLKSAKVSVAILLFVMVTVVACLNFGLYSRVFISTLSLGIFLFVVFFFFLNRE